MDRPNEGALRSACATGIGSWSAAHAESQPPGAHCHEVEAAEWPAFCRWFTETFRGIALSAQSREGSAPSTQAIDLPLEFIQTNVLEHGVDAITIAVKTGTRLRRLNITDARHLRMYCNAAGWPTELEIVTQAGNVLLRFSGRPDPLPHFSSAGWGE